MATLLRRRRLEVGVAADGLEAQQALQAQRWDVLVLDLMMPRVDGWTVIDWLAGHPEHRPRSVLVMTASDRAALRSLDPQVVNAILFKPFDAFVLADYVKSAAERSEDRRRARMIGGP